MIWLWNDSAPNKQPQYLLPGRGGGWRLWGVGRSAAAVDHASPEESDDKAEEAGEDGEQREGASSLDVGRHGGGGRVRLTLHLTCGLYDAVQPQTIPHLAKQAEKVEKVLVRRPKNPVYPVKKKTGACVISVHHEFN